jgi:peptidoglycan/LPS O-acetylase OafA/YrhL
VQPGPGGSFLSQDGTASTAEGPGAGGDQLFALHAFRVVAMLFVVAQHAMWAGVWPAGSTARVVLADLLDNSSVLFVFLTGYLFHHVAARRSYREFLARRLTRVLVPYLVIALPAAVLAAVSPRAAGAFAGPVDQPILVRTAWYLVNGATQVNIALWFVPMVVLFYLLAPVFQFVARRPHRYWVLLVLVPLSLLAHRPTLQPAVDPLAMTVYFASAYIAGMCASHHRERLQPLLRRHWLPLSLAFLAVLVAQVLLAGHHGNYSGAALFSQEHGLIDWMLAQKLLLCVVLLGAAERFTPTWRVLRVVGLASFSVFLLHCYVVNAVKLSAESVGMGLGSLAGCAATTLVAVGASLLVVRAAWAVLGRRSVYVVGSAPVR